MLELIESFFGSTKFLQSMNTIWLSVLVLSAFVLTLCWIADFVTKKYLVHLLNLLVVRAHPSWAEFIFKNKVIRRLSTISPALIIFWCAPAFVVEKQPLTLKLSTLLKDFSLIYLIIAVTFSLHAVFLTLEDIYNTFKVARKRPIKSYLQVLKVFLYLICIILVVSIILNKSPEGFFTGLGAATAILLLVFKDTILGFIASIQLASYDMIRIGDWITLSSYEADGDVVEISLNTVKVRNFDKTITTIPTYALLSSGVKNWRGMQEAGGRRIKRSIKIDMNSIKFCTDDLLNKIKKIRLLDSYLADKLEEIKLENSSKHVQDAAINGRQLTNIGLYRAYVYEYLQNNIHVHHTGFTFLVRHLAPAETGLPIEVYIFTKDTRWSEHEQIQADIFDHQ